MGYRYAIQEEITLNNGDSIIGLEGSTTARPMIYDLMLGCAATPADQACNYTVGRFTTDGTATNALTPVPLDPAAPASTAVAQGVYTTEPGYTADEELLNISVNQRATFRWVAAPGGELVCPATTDNGIGVLCKAVTSGYLAQATIHFEE